VSSTGRAIRAVTLSAQNSVRIAELAYNSFHSKILPVSLTRSRFCGEKFFAALCFQDFASCGGRGGIQQLSVVGGQLSVPDVETLPSFRPSARALWRAAKSEKRMAATQ
jgi:hypothetical protein